MDPAFSRKEDGLADGTDGPDFGDVDVKGLDKAFIVGDVVLDVTDTAHDSEGSAQG